MKVFFVGIGGIGMSALALIAKEKGIEVIGSDIKLSDNVIALKNKGITVFDEQKKENISSDIDLLVYSSAVDISHPELSEALKKGIRIMKRAEFLNEMIQDKFSFVVVGSHGKTTTSSMVASVLYVADKGNSFYVGGILSDFGTNAFWGKGKFMAVELDESDGTFLHFKKDVALITNIELEHIDFYKNEENYFLEFARFINEFKGEIFIGKDGYKKIKSYLKRDVNVVDMPEKYGENWFLFDNRKIELKKYGNHYVFDAYLTAYALKNNGFDIEIIKEGLEKYSGSKRREEIIFENDQFILIDDYAHHPTEIEKTFSALKKRFPQKRIISLFQPHRYSRFTAFYDDYKEFWSNATGPLIILPVYAASEKKNGKESFDLFSDIRNIRKDIFFANGLEEGYEILISLLRKDDLVVSFGAGDLNQILFKLKRRLENG